MHLKVSSAKWRPFCPGGDGLDMFLLIKWYTAKIVDDILRDVAIHLGLKDTQLVYWRSYPKTLWLQSLWTHRIYQNR